MIERIPQHLQPVRDPGPYEPGRVCVCGCVLSRNNPGPKCQPCQISAMPAAELIADTLNSMDITPFPDPDLAA